MSRVAIAALLALATTFAFATPAIATEPRASLTDIEDEVMCPICGTPLNLAAAPQAERERAFIRRLIAKGRTKEEIKDELVAEFGPEVLATPEGEGFDLAAWAVPAGAILVAAAALALGVRRWRRGPASGPRDEPERLDPADSERLRKDLANYDL